MTYTLELGGSKEGKKLGANEGAQQQPMECFSKFDAENTVNQKIVPHGGMVKLSPEMQQMNKMQVVQEHLATASQPASVQHGRVIPFLRERIALTIAKLVKENKLDDARKWADALVKGAPDFKIGVQMRDTLADTKLAAAARDKRIAALAEEARKPIDAVIRQAELRRRLDERLYRLAHTPTSQPAPDGLTLSDNGVRVTLLLADVKPDTLAALTKAGLKQEAVARTTQLVVGLAPRDKLSDIAMVDAVRKVDPTVLDQ